MTVKDAQPNSSTTQGVTAHMLAHQGLYETRRGMFGGHVPLFDPNAPTAEQQAGQGQGAQQPQGSQQQATPEFMQALQNLIGRTGGVDRTAELLFHENHGYRERIRALEGQVPAQGSVVLNAEQAQQWQAFQQLGDPALLRTRLTEGDQAIEREQGRQYAEVSGANAEVLSDRLRASGLRAEIRETPGQNGAAPTRALHLIRPGQNGTADADLGDVRAYAQQHWPAYETALFPTGTNAPAPVRQVTPQSGPSTPPAGLAGIVEQRLAAREQAAASTTGATK